MAAKPPKAFDVWFVAAEQVYKGVPYNVVADWTQQGRLAPTDMVRPTGTKEGWVKISAHEFARGLPPGPGRRARRPRARARVRGGRRERSRSGATAGAVGFTGFTGFDGFGRTGGADRSEGRTARPGAGAESQSVR